MKKILFAIMFVCSVFGNAQLKRFDLNRDGTADVADLSFLTNYLLHNENGYEYVDLGLSVNWAACNVGAIYPEDYGLYFAWGETTGYTSDTSDGKAFDWENYSLCKGSYTTITKYCTSSEYGTVDNKTTIDSSDDAATVNWGGKWRMPTTDELEELRTSCTWTWTALNGVNGYKVTGTNGNYIFLPAAGYRCNNDINDFNSKGYYWSSSLSTGSSSSAYRLSFDSVQITKTSYGRYYGRSIRPVCR